MRANDGHVNSNFTGNTASFPLVGGLYGMDVIATGSGTVTLQKIGADGSTWITAATAISTSGTYQTAYLIPGTYRWSVATFTAVYAEIVRIPSD